MRIHRERERERTATTWRQGIWVWSEVFVCKAGDEVRHCPGARLDRDVELENIRQESLGIQQNSTYDIL